MKDQHDADDLVTKKARIDDGNEESLDNKAVELTYLELYSGVGGWTMALSQAMPNFEHANVKIRRLIALDHSDLCTKVFEHNFGSDSKSFAIEKLTTKQINSWKAGIWVMSPPCQPHTRQHSNQAADMKDPRSTSFLHLVDLLHKMDENCLPSLIFLENVVGFESSNSFDHWVQALQKRDYQVCSFHLTPTQVGLPNDRPRYFGLAIKKSRATESRGSTSSDLSAYWNTTAAEILKGIPELGVAVEYEESQIPTISTFLDDSADSTTLQVPSKVLEGNAAWCFDIVSPKSRRSSCFTQSYGRYIRGTGSVLYQDDDRNIVLMAPEAREFEQDWAKDLDLTKLRYFSGSEMARLMGFPLSFSFPTGYTNKQQWKLIGNSLNVRVASKVVELGLLMLMGRPPK